MSGLMQSTFGNLRKHPKIIPISLLVVGAGGGGAQGVAFSVGKGGHAGYGAQVYDTSNVIGTDFTYTATVAGTAQAGYSYYPGYGSSNIAVAAGSGGASSLAGIFRYNTGLIAYGGAGGVGYGGGDDVNWWNGNQYVLIVGAKGIDTLGSGTYSSITGTNTAYGFGASGGGYRVYIGGSGGGAGGTGYGGGGGGGGGAGQGFGYSGDGASGGAGAAGVVIMRCRKDAYTTYTATGGSPNVTFLNIDSIEYSVFKWTTSGSIIFTKT